MPWHTRGGQKTTLSQSLLSSHLYTGSKEPTQVIRRAHFTAKLSTWSHLVFSRPRFIQITTLGLIFFNYFYSKVIILNSTSLTKSKYAASF